MISFADLNLSPELQKAISDLNYEQPTPIQIQALPILLGDPTDFVGLAATGTGKTAAFAIPIIEQIDPENKSVQILILVPTRELALQVAGQIDLLGKYKGIKSVAIYGGVEYAEQNRKIQQGATIVVGTPGRVVDHLQKKSIKLENLKTVILDEADEMMSMGFRDELETILAAIPRKNAQTWLFSATMEKDVRRVADTYLRNPKQVQINKTDVIPSTIKQLYYIARESDKAEILCKLIDTADHFYGLIFCQTKNLVSDLSLYLSERGYRVDSLHGDKDQESRERTMRAFRERRVSILVCTDVASRGLDVKDITHVVNYSIPRELESYIHRIGRTARSGKAGFALSLITPAYRRLILDLEKITNSRIEEGQIPTRKEIGVKKISKLLTTFQDQDDFVRAQLLLDENWKKALAGLTSEEVAARFLTMTYPEIFIDKTATQNSARRSSLSDNQVAGRPLASSEPGENRRSEERPDRRGNLRAGYREAKRADRKYGARNGRRAGGPSDGSRGSFGSR